MDYNRGLSNFNLQNRLKTTNLVELGVRNWRQVVGNRKRDRTDKHKCTYPYNTAKLMVNILILYGKYLNIFKLAKMLNVPGKHYSMLQHNFSFVYPKS